MESGSTNGTTQEHTMKNKHPSAFERSVKMREEISKTAVHGRTCRRHDEAISWRDWRYFPMKLEERNEEGTPTSSSNLIEHWQVPRSGKCANKCQEVKHILLSGKANKKKHKLQSNRIYVWNKHSRRWERWKTSMQQRVQNEGSILKMEWIATRVRKHRREKQKHTPVGMRMSK